MSSETLLDPYAWACKCAELKVFSKGVQKARSGVVSDYVRLKSVVLPQTSYC